MAALRRPSGLLIDLSGTIHIENQEIKGSIEAVNQLRKQKIPFLFVTNTSKVIFFFIYIITIQFTSVFSLLIYTLYQTLFAYIISFVIGITNRPEK